MNDLTINLDVHSSVSLYEQIYKHIKKEIQNGGLPFGERLPSTRKLAKYLQVSRTTVDMAYEQLISEGYIEAQPYKGYFVCELEGLYHLETQAAPARKIIQKVSSETYPYDFSPNGVDLNSFPYNTWRRLSRNILLEESGRLFQLGDPQGEYELRRTIAQYLRQARGVEAVPDRVIVGAGNDFLLLLLCSMFGTGQRIAMESPTYKKAYDLLGNLSNVISIVDMDESGMKVDQLEETDAQIAYVMPSHQYPLGTVMPVKRRMQLLDWAGSAPGRYIIEDDYDSEFRYKGKPIPALQGYDRNDRVIYIGTFSKSVAPAIRVSYMVLPNRLMELYEKRGKTISCTVSRVDQMLIASFLNGGYYERHLNKMRAVYKGRHDVLLEELKAFRGISRISGENAGVHLLVTFRNGMSEQEAVQRAARHGVKVYGLSGYFVGEAKLPAEGTVILGYANLPEDEIRSAAARLRAAWLDGGKQEKPEVSENEIQSTAHPDGFGKEVSGQHEIF